ncbi:unnamed protein product [Haemonchus placei]|uniref:DUF1758 domain-containing protein n=1 Tax=Haemonchus placei TaxID=6290 RepID=A0A0N4WQ09_HAEPC|nr:unnamed protein product [Haemonchus placei]
MKLCTFGEKQPKEIQSIDTYLQVWDSTGEQHNLHVFTRDGLTKTYHRGRLEKKDLQFIRENHLTLIAPKEGETHAPQILIMCDQSWNFMNFKGRNFVLPSGFLLVPTRLGYMVTGKRSAKEGGDTCTNSSIHAVELHSILGQWEHHWTIQPHEMDREFCGPGREERAHINAQVLANFNNSIEKKDKGYVARLPLKDDHKRLPDNRALTIHRLKSIMQKYKDKPDLLRQYNHVFKNSSTKTFWK